MITWLASYPRSGNFLLRTLIHQTMGLKSYPYPREKNKLENAIAGEIIGNVAYDQEWEEFYSTHNSSQTLILIKTHDAPCDPNPAIYVVRDGRKVLYSYYLYQLAHAKEASHSLLELVLGADWFGDWSIHYHEWITNSPHPRLLLRYEDLVQAEATVIHEIRDFLGCREEIKSWNNPMEELKVLMPKMFRQGHRTWEKPLEWTPLVDRAFWAVQGDLMMKLGYATEQDFPEMSSTEISDWQHLSTLLKQRVEYAEHTSKIENELLSTHKLLQREKWVRQHLKKISRRKPKPLKSPVRWCLQKWIDKESWQPGKLHQHDPIPFSPPPAPPAPKKTGSKTSIAIVVPSYNQGEYIAATVRSILNQKYENLQLAIMDGGSNDGTQSILEPFEKNFSHYRSHADEGQAAAINEGFSKVQGDIFAWLNSDDLFMPGTLELVSDYFDRNPKVDVVYGHRLIIDSAGREVGRWILPPHNNDDLKWFDLVPQETMFFRKSLWEKVGGLDTSFKFALDWDLLVRFMEANAKIVRLPFLMGAFRVHNLQKTTVIIGSVGQDEMLRIRTRIHGENLSAKTLNTKYRNYKLRALLYAKLFRRKIYI